MTHAPRPVFLSLTQIRMPVGAVTSIGHRVAGVVLAASVPVGIYILALSLRDEQGWDAVTRLAGTVAFKAATVVVVWAFAHHGLAGVRHLLSDFDIGSPLHSARRSAWFVNLGGVLVALLAAGLML